MRTSRCLLQCGLLFFIFLFAVLPVSHAQYRAGIQGVVEDPTGAGIPAAALTLTNKDTGLVQTTTSDASGTYNFLSLPPGNYSIDAEATGFSKKTLANVTLAAEQTQAINIQLALGQVQQTVTVTAPVTPAIDTETGQIGTTITSSEIQNLPNVGRDPYKLLGLALGTLGNSGLGSGGGAQLTPGNAQGPGGTSLTSSIFQTENQVQINADGTRSTTNNFQIDGIEVNSLDWGGAAIITPNEESVKAVEVVANPYDATLGRGSGAQVEVVSQNGTNHLHGSFFFKIDRPGLNAYQGYNGPSGPSADQRVANRFNQIGGSIGGPIIKNHLFFFFSYETLRMNTTNTGTTWVETPQFDTAAAAESGYIAGTLLSFPGEDPSYTKVLPVSCGIAGMGSLPLQCQPAGTGLDVGSLLTGSAKGSLDPTYGQTATPYGIGNGLDGVPDIQFVQYANPTKDIATQYNGRIDYQVTPSDLVAYTIYWVPNDSTFFNGQAARPADLWHSDRLNYSEALLWNHVISSTAINELRFNVSRWYFNELNSNPQEPWGLPLAFMNNTGSAGFSFGTQGPGIFYKTNYNIRDVLTKVQGNHTFKVGTDIYKEQNKEVLSGAGRPDYVFDNLWDFANDAPYNEFGNFDPQTGVPTNATGHYRTAVWALFAQDDFKIKPNLTVNLGLRWEYFGPISETSGLLSYPILGPFGDELTGLSLGVGGDLYHASNHDFGPQFGFAWSPTRAKSRLVVRGGVGLGYDRIEEATLLNVESNIPFQSFFDFQGPSAADILYAVPSNTHQFFNWPANPHALLVFNPTTNLPVAGSSPVTLYGTSRVLPTPETWRFSLETQYDLGHSWIATIGYQGNQSHRYTRLQNVNWEYTPTNPLVNNLDLFTDDVNGDYNALLTELQHHFAQTFELDVQYVYSRAMDGGSSDFFSNVYGYNDAYEFDGGDYNWGPSDYDVTHNVKVWGTWSPKFSGAESWWMKEALDGWSFSPIWNLHSGFPWSPFYDVQVNGQSNSLIYPGSGYQTVRPQAYLGGAGHDYSNASLETGPTPTDSTETSKNFPNGPTAYFTPPTITPSAIPPPPGVGRNSFRGPRYNDLDMTVAKSFGLPRTALLGEDANIEIRANFYNFLNQTNLTPFGSQQVGTINVTTSGPETVTPNSAFAEAQGALAGRVLEMQARFSF
jgi:Carboxypeptidase regulatory-like domain/TonB dependent receptor